MLELTLSTFAERTLFLGSEPLHDALLTEDASLALTAELGRIEKAILLTDHAGEHVLDCFSLFQISYLYF